MRRKTIRRTASHAAIIVAFVSAALVLTYGSAGAVQPCKKYEKDVRRYHQQYFGIDFPYEYSVAQLYKESMCRGGMMSSDGIGSEGPAQITFNVWKDKLQEEGIAEINTISNHLRAQAYINRLSYDRAKCKKLFVLYQLYNGGPLVNTEIQRAGSCDWTSAYKACKRKDIKFKNGQVINACTINYDYSKKIFDFAEEMRKERGFSGDYEFW
jgi:hypothetical protein